MCIQLNAAQDKVFSILKSSWTEWVEISESNIYPQLVEKIGLGHAEFNSVKNRAHIMELFFFPF